MSNSGAWSGDHSEQLEEMYETIVSSEKFAGRNVTKNDSIRIRAEIAEAYDEVIRCFDKENADPSIVTYAINLMKSTVATTNDLRNMSQLALAISESTIGALYLVNELEEKNRKREEREYKFNYNEEEHNTEELTKKIDISLDSNVIDALCSEENERAYDELNKRAKSGDKNAIIAIDLIKKSINFMHFDKSGKVKASARDVSALALVDKLVTTGEIAALTTAEQMIESFELDKYDIYTQDEIGKKAISVDKVRTEVGKCAKKSGINIKPELIQGLKRENDTIDGITKRYAREAGEMSSMNQIITSVESQHVANRILTNATKILQESGSYVAAQGQNSDFDLFITNNLDKVPGAVAHRLEFLNQYGSRMKKSTEMFNIISAIATTRKSIQHSQMTEKNYVTRKYDEFYTQGKNDEPIKNDGEKSIPDDDER